MAACLSSPTLLSRKWKHQRRRFGPDVHKGPKAAKTQAVEKDTPKTTCFKSRRFAGPPPFGLPPIGLTPIGLPPIGLPPFGLRGHLD